MLRLGFLILSLMILASCVGTVSETAPAFTKVSEGDKNQVLFNGVDSATAISDTRIEVFFYAATGGSGFYSYDIYVGTNPTPVTVSSDVLSREWNGKIKVTLTGLQRLTTYKIRAEARDTRAQNGARTDTGRIVSVSTFAHEVADFGGIIGASNVAGQDGKDSIRIRWAPARISGSLSPQNWDPKIYEIVLVTADGVNALKPSEMDLTVLQPSDGRFVYQINHNDAINEYIVRGLPSNTEFYVRMRALHQTSEVDVYDVTKRSELNTNVVKIRTLSDDIADINFQEDSFAVRLSSGSAGLTSVETSWARATGVFDHFRIYYGKKGAGVADNNLPELCLSPLQSNPTASVFCKKVDLNASSATVTGLDPYEEYEVVLVMCINTTCTGARRITPSRDIITDPSVPNFAGITGVKSAANISELGSLRLQFTPPDFSIGYFDGLILYSRRSADESAPDLEVAESPTNDNPIYFSSYDYANDNLIMVHGIDYLSDQPYCFSLVPFKWDGVLKNPLREGTTWRCIQPQVLGPDNLQFEGASTVVFGQRSIDVFWNAPQAGVYSHYEILYRKLSHSFIFGTATNEVDEFNFTNYGRVVVDSSKASATITNLPSGNYAVGVLTYYEYMGPSGIVRVRSEANAGVFRCTINNASVDSGSCVPMN